MHGVSQIEAESRPLAPREPIVPNGVLGMLIFVLTECMLFAGMVSAFSIVKASATDWPPLGQPRLPIEVTAINTVVLLLSGVALVVALRRFKGSMTSARRPLAIAIVLGATFIAIQGAEWAALIHEGLTLTSGQLGGFFYLIVGCHALHAAGAILALGWAAVRLFRGKLQHAELQTVTLLWVFVVGLWPFLYYEVYL